MPKNTPVRATSAKKTATKKPARRTATRTVSQPATTSQDLIQRWPGGITDNLPEDVRLAIIALEWLVLNSKQPRKAIGRLHVLVSGVRLSPLAAYVSEIRLTGFHKGFVDALVKQLGGGER